MRKFPAAFAALQYPAFAWLWIGLLCSNIGSWMHTFASRWLIFHITGSEAMLGIDAAVSGLTTALLLLPGGVLADRAHRRNLLIAGNTLAAINVAALALAAHLGYLSVWRILLVSFISGMLQAVIAPAQQSIIPQVVPRSVLSNAVALNSLQFNTSRLIGPVIAGAVYLSLGAAWCFSINSASYLVLVAALLWVRTSPMQPTEHEPVSQALRAGLGYLQDRKDLSRLILLVACNAFFSAPAVSMLPSLAKTVLGGGSETFSALMAAFGIGAVLGALYAAFQAQDRDPADLTGIRTHYLLLAAAEIGLFFTTNLLAVMVLVGVCGWTMIATMVRLGSALQHLTEEGYRGRVVSVHTLAFRGSQPLGSLVSGLIASGITHGGITGGVQYSFLFSGLCLAATLTLLPSNLRRAGSET